MNRIHELREQGALRELPPVRSSWQEAGPLARRTLRIHLWLAATTLVIAIAFAVAVG